MMRTKNSKKNNPGIPAKARARMNSGRESKISKITVKIYIFDLSVNNKKA